MTLKIGVSRGHGKYTAGKRSPAGEREWYFNNVVANAFIRYMTKFDNVEIIEVADPTGEVDTGLVERTNLANKYGVDIYIAFHHNAYQGVWFNGGGSEVHVRPNAPQAAALARIAAPLIAKAMGLANRGVKVTNLHETREPHQIAMLIEGGFMDSNQDIVAMRDESKLTAQGEAVGKAVEQYFGLKSVKGNTDKPAASPTPKPAVKPASSNKYTSVVNYLDDRKIDSSYNNRARLAKTYGIKNYQGTEAQNIELLKKLQSGAKPVKQATEPKSKSVSQMADEVESGKHGDGHYNRRISLGVTQAVYNKVKAEVNRRAGVSKPKRSINEMAREIINNPRVPKGHAARQKWLGVGNATYAKVRAKVNQLM
ncbi:N-acetylmuramoyl-L-alanine amidase [Salinicoccus sesuvii]|uniref:N-acetylmuramoyl-L-alanine amidase n=1 Tax=Salinicoccus sesuvii TaxID=868281 RepID=A0ABV7N6V8_9STAP